MRLGRSTLAVPPIEAPLSRSVLGGSGLIIFLKRFSFTWKNNSAKSGRNKQTTQIQEVKAARTELPNKQTSKQKAKTTNKIGAQTSKK